MIAGRARRPLFLHQMTVTDVDPVAFVRIASSVGAAGVALFLDFFGAPSDFPLVRASHKAALRRALADEGLEVGSLDFFVLTAKPDWDDFCAKLELGAELGGRRAVVLIGDNDPARATDGLARFASAAAGVGLDVGVEFMALTPPCNSIVKAASLIEAAGASNVRIGLDILHLTRTGGTPSDIGKVPAALIGHAQICDGTLAAPADMVAEAVSCRMIPGEGEFPLSAFLAALPPGLEIDVEVPLEPLRAEGVGAEERARRVMLGARSIVDSVGG